MAMGQQPPPVNQKALEAIISGHYSRVLGLPEAARTRSQTAYTIASATAAALVAAGVLGGIGQFPWWVQAAGGSALLGWVISAAFFIAVSARGSELKALAEDAPDALLSAHDFVQRALEAAKRAAREIEGTLRAAVISTWVALGLTVAALALALATPAQAERADSIVALSDEGADTVALLCDSPLEQLAGELQLDTLGEDYAVLEVAPGGCQPDQVVAVRIPSKQIVAVVSAKDD